MAKTAVWFGDTNTWKTTQLKFAAKYLFAKYKKPIRMVTAENWEGIQSLVEIGVIDLVQFTADTLMGNPLPAIVKLSRGWWPGDNERGARVLLPPGKGSNDLTKVCAYFFEGLTSISSVLMTDEKNKHRKHSQEPVAPFEEDGIKFCAANMSHYNFVQMTMLERLAEFEALPVERVIITAHEASGEDEDTKDPIRGPGLIGRKGTDKVGPKVGALIHFEKYVKVETQKDAMGKPFDIVTGDVRAFFVDHPDQKFANIKYKCKPRMDVGNVTEFRKKFPGGYVQLGLESGMDLMLAAEDELAGQTLERDLKWKEEVLGAG